MNVTLTVQTQQQEFPAGTVGGNWRFTLTGKAAIQTPNPTATFTLVAPGVYTATVQRMPVGSSTGIGPLISEEITVIDQPVSIEVAAGLTVTVSVP